ncbi:hypothetical protein SAMN05216188_11880 [Lentzea xinjiangensis]|uniref:Uncharacterized protein n=1 Tax=Lentzea xinjiangensis TaxID=402600 RepID=A0A1H9TFA8_9PSEU|nr:hypothetical protein [Lentzea xinjiangensis]SER95717.1 hypothetical protein SAMN05216188_11880 [Lentzea xinjiangensis]
MSWFSKSKPEPQDNDNTTDTWHVKTVLSTKPGHRVLRKERCDCAHGQASGQCMAYETPSS